jgi:hypothetical protein
LLHGGVNFDDWNNSLQTRRQLFINWNQIFAMTTPSISIDPLECIVNKRSAKGRKMKTMSVTSSP